MRYSFYDTCSLLEHGESVFCNSEKFYISNITLKELEQIKTSAFKDADIKYKTRKLIHLLAENRDCYKVINFKNSWNEQIKNSSILMDNDDSKIIFTAFILGEKLSLNGDSILFITGDLCCEQIASSLNLETQYLIDKELPYNGYIYVDYNNDDQLADIYSKVYSSENYFDLYQNEYLLIRDSSKKIIDKYKKEKNELKRIPEFYCFDSRMFGKVKPKDDYQILAMDSFETNRITMVKGPAGTGKSYLSLGYLFNQLEHGKIDKIIIFCNTVATNGSAKLGYYPGSRDEKLLDSQIGNFLASKLGDKEAVIQYMEKGSLLLLPMSDIRGFDTSGMKAGIYITEAQNMDIELMRLALQRIGEDSICILDGDSDAQVDLNIYAGSNNGMKRVSKVFRGESIYGEVTLPNIYRSRIANIAQKM